MNSILDNMTEEKMIQSILDGEITIYKLILVYIGNGYHLSDYPFLIKWTFAVFREWDPFFAVLVKYLSHYTELPEKFRHTPWDDDPWFVNINPNIVDLVALHEMFYNYYIGQYSVVIEGFMRESKSTVFVEHLVQYPEILYLGTEWMQKTMETYLQASSMSMI